MPVNMSKEEQRKAHRDARRRQQQMRRLIFYTIVVFVVIVIGIILSFTVFFNLNNLEIRGYSIYEKSQIEAVCGVQKGDHLLLINKDKVVEHITEKLPYIGEVTVKVVPPSKLIITVAETSVKCVVDNGSEYVLLNENAKVLGTAANLDAIYAGAILEGGEAYNEEAPLEGTPTYVLEDKDFIILEGVKIKSANVGKTVEFKTEKTLEVYTEIMNLFETNEITGITQLDLSDIYNITMMYEDRFLVKVGSVTNLDKKMALGAKVIKTQSQASADQEGVIDLTIDKKAYFNPKQETTTTTVAPETTTSADGTTTTTKKG